MDATSAARTTQRIPNNRVAPADQLDSCENGSSKIDHEPNNTKQLQSQQEAHLPNNKHHSQQNLSRPKQHQRQHTVGGGTGRLHGRVPSSKALHRHHGSTSKLNARRQQSPPPPLTSAYRRVQSDVKLGGESDPAALKRNRSHHDVTRRIKSIDKLKGLETERTRPAAAPSSLHNPNPQKGPKAQVHFELGVDGPADDWVDARVPPSPSPEQLKDRKEQHKEYLTSIILARTQSHGGAAPKMTSETASVGPSQTSLGSGSSTAPGTPPGTATAASSGNRDELTSRFITGPSSGIAAAASFYDSERRPMARSADEGKGSGRRRSLASLSVRSSRGEASDSEDKPHRKPAPPPAEISRTQQKLNLQRASSVIDPAQAVGPVAGGVDPLVDVQAPGYDGVSSRDPRVGKLIERTGMEYLVVRRYQNPVTRSLGRLKHLSGSDKVKRIPAGSVGGPVAANGGRGGANAGVGGGPGVGPAHIRSGSRVHGERDGGPEDPRRPVTPQRSQLIRTTGTGSSLETEDGTPKMNDAVGRFILGHDENHGNGTATALRNLWEKSLDLSTSQD